MAPFGRVFAFQWTALACLLLSCGPWIDGLRSPGTVINRFERMAEQGPGTLIPLQEVTPFGYEVAYIFGPYTEVALMQSWLNADLEEATRLARGIERRDDIHLLVFTFQHSAMESMEIPRGRVEFGPEVSKCGFISKDAVFLVKKGGILGLAPGIPCEDPRE